MRKWKQGLGFCQALTVTMMFVLFLFVHWFIFDNRKKYHVNRMCRTLSVNEKGYYKWLRNGEKTRKWQDLLVEIHRILDNENPSNG